MTETVDQFLKRGGVIKQCQPQAVPKMQLTVEGTGTRARPTSGEPRQIRRGSVANAQMTYK